MFSMWNWRAAGPSYVPYHPETEDLQKELEDLVDVLIDVNANPIPLSYTFLKKITNDFAKEREIGRGGFGVVYMGVLPNHNVAVKMLDRTDDFSEKQFEDELMCLMRVKHKNIVRCLGYCSESRREVAEHNGKFVLADVQQRLLCFEFVPNKSLKENLNVLREKAEKDDWNTHYQLIEGICNGLRYLHNEEHIIHVDLNPGNILLDDGMVPKIADFGLSRRFGEEQSRVITMKIYGILGYVAPESINKGELSFKSDIYTLGIIFMNILRGSKDLSDFENWHKSLVTSNPQVKRWIEIAQLSVNVDKHRRPSMDEIIDMLNKEETVHGHSTSFAGSALKKMMQSLNWIGLRRVQSCEEENQLLISAEPLKLRFHWKPKHLISCCPLHLRNNTDDPVAFRIRAQKNTGTYFLGPLYGLVLPRSSYSVHVTMSKQLENNCLMMLESTKADNSYLPHIEEFNCADRYFVEAKKNGRKVQQVKLAVILAQEPGNMIIQEYTSNIKLMCVHPTETWVITVRGRRGSIDIWDYHTQKNVDNSFSELHSSDITTLVFVTQKKWLLTGGNAGYLNVYNYERMTMVKSFKYHNSRNVTSAEIHPTKPYVLLASHDHTEIMMLNWERDWRYLKGYRTQGRIHQIKFNPMDSDYFACASMDGLEIWNINSSIRPEFILARDTSEVQCFDYLIREDMLYVITGHTDGSVNIWDYNSRTRVKKLGEHAEKVATITVHPNLPVLITGSDDGIVRLWSSITYMLQGMLNCGLGRVRAIACLRESNRIVIGHDRGLSLTEI